MIALADAEEVLKHEYQRENFEYLVKEILLPDYKPDFHETENNSHLFQNVNYLGESLQCDISVFEVEIAEGVENRRVAITQAMFKLLKGLRIDNALIAFYNNDKLNFRISLLTSKYEYDGDKIVKILSNPRRYSYSLGYGTKTKTAYDFLIKKGRVANLDELISRFSVEVVNKDFYRQIATCFTMLVGGNRDGMQYDKMMNLHGVVDQNKYAEFAVRLIGRIMFCWFLKEKKSEKGMPLIPESMFSVRNYLDDTKSYYHEVLEPLFFELLNINQNRRKDKYLTEEIYKQIPYLNGGLFNSQSDDFYKYDRINCCGQYGMVNIPNEWFKKFFGVLGQYNFTVDENTSYDIELSIDPEMLGRIFENLLAEINPETGTNAKKSTGSFYTPRDIVDYMVDNSILEYLKEKTGINEIKLKALISYNKDDDDLAVFDVDEQKSIIKALYSVTVLDPACGSGAFPIGMLQKIVYVLQEIDPEANLWFNEVTKDVPIFIKKEFEKKFNAGSLNYIRKLSVIQNSIFGIDIQPIAVEISRLRCFLSLIIEEKVDDSEPNRGINPLPNLDFKIIIANSLEYLDSQKIEVQKQKIEIGSLLENEYYIAELKAVREEYFNAEIDRRAELKLEFSEIQKKMFKDTIENYGAKNASTKYQQLSDWSPFINKPTSWFDPEWMFGVKEGFDIVIANPPYVDYRKIENFNSKNRYYVSKVSKMINLYVYFFEFGINMLSKGGILSFISPQQYLILDNTKGLRDILRQNTVISLSDFSFAKVFDAGTYPFVSIIKKSCLKMELRYLEFNQIRNTENYLSELFIENPIPEPVVISKNLNLINKIQRTGIQLKDIAKSIFVATSTKQEKVLNGKYEYLEASDILINQIGKVRNRIDFTNTYSANSKNAQMGKIIYTSRMTNKIRAVCLNNNNKYLGGKINVVIPKPNEEMFVVALLNSKLINFWFAERFAMTHMQGGAFPINAEDLKLIPIVNDNKELIKQISLVTEKTYEKISASECNIEQFYIQIDNLIYQLYGLTEEEIKIIEEQN